MSLFTTYKEIVYYRRRTYVPDLSARVLTELSNYLNKGRKWQSLVPLLLNGTQKDIDKLGLEENPTQSIINIWAQYKRPINDLSFVMFRLNYHDCVEMLSPYMTLRARNTMIRMIEKFPKGKRRARFPIFDIMKIRLEGKTIGEEMADFRNRSLSRHAGHVTPRKNVVKATKLVGNRKVHSLNQLNVSDLKRITDNWSEDNIIGRGTFGVSYEGMYKGKIVVVKRLDPLSYAKRKEYGFHVFHTFQQITLLNSGRHLNILPVQALCLNGEISALVYRMMPFDSLRKKLDEGNSFLTWSKRLFIAAGISNGLKFLHTCWKVPLIHGDVKSSNVLLDSYLEPKLGDYSLVTSVPDRIAYAKDPGLRPYMPREYLKTKVLTEKVDAYGFGVIMYELATGLPPYDNKRRNLREYIDDMDEDCVTRMYDLNAGKLDDTIYTQLMVLGKWCTVKEEDRLDINQIHYKLEQAYLLDKYRMKCVPKNVRLP